MKLGQIGFIRMYLVSHCNNHVYRFEIIQIVYHDMVVHSKNHVMSWFWPGQNRFILGFVLPWSFVFFAKCELSFTKMTLDRLQYCGPCTTLWETTDSFFSWSCHKLQRQESLYPLFLVMRKKNECELSGFIAKREKQTISNCRNYFYNVKRTTAMSRISHSWLFVLV